MRKETLQWEWLELFETTTTGYLWEA